MAKQNRCHHSSCAWAPVQGRDCHPGVSYQPHASTCRALHRSYANLTAKSSLFLMTHIIAYAKRVHPARDCLARCHSPPAPVRREGWDPQHPAVPPASAEAPSHKGRCKNLTTSKFVSVVAQAVVFTSGQYTPMETAAQVCPSHVAVGEHSTHRWKVSYFI